MDADVAPPEKRRRLERVTAACDLCKRRKVKCDGELPCGYCKRKHRADTCHFTAPKPRNQVRSAGNTPKNPEQIVTKDAVTPSAGRDRSYSEGTPRRPQVRDGIAAGIGTSLSPTVSRSDHQEDTVVPLEGRILRDAQGKVIFVGDCAPLSFLQTVRHLIASEVDAESIPLQATRDSIIEVARPASRDQHQSLAVELHQVPSLVHEYIVATSGLADLFDPDELLKELKTWTSGLTSHSNDAAAAVFFLVLAVGAQESHESKAEAWFKHARDLLLKNMTSSMNVSTVQGFALVAIFMLRAFQPNGAYLYFSLATRTAYAIGLHRTEVNASFGESLKVTRDRIWSSLRVIDILMSNILGRPPSSSDVDCTVKYHAPSNNTDISGDLLDASVQIFMIIERVVVEVYSRKRISLRIASYVSHQLKGWASNWLKPLSEIAKMDQTSIRRKADVGACSTLCSYFYGIMLLTRPFLIYELYEYMGASLKGGGTQADHEEKRKYADAALDAAASFVETLQAVVNTAQMPLRMPLVVSWLFTTSLVLAVGVLGRSGLTFEDTCRTSVRCLDYFGKADPHARQYSLIVQALLKTTVTHVKKRELHLRSQRKQASSQLFGMLSNTSDSSIPAPVPERYSSPPLGHVPPTTLPPDATNGAASADWTIYDADFFALPWITENDQGLQDFLQPGTHTLNGASVADIPLFPIYDQQTGGGFF
ncbi:Filamentous growth regulator 27 [Pseudocercospora fuligena]|uniref:Filamentous growth regulator 27 n=1 Tax=Pseudocercospora fuligena TaxID=685502 RepID=A0A8H6RDR8_9PEZI|nr:Filamentous growth regulator 27 [Pseudocercospora fuligena]